MQEIELYSRHWREIHFQRGRANGAKSALHVAVKRSLDRIDHDGAVRCAGGSIKTGGSVAGALTEVPARVAQAQWKP